MGIEDYYRYPTGKIDKGTWCDHCARFNTRYSVCDIIIFKQGKILLQKRQQQPMQGWWSLCGGYLNWDETLEDAAKREVYEEVGYKLENITFFKNFSDPARDPDGKQNICHVFIAHVEDNPPQLNPNEVQETRWFDVENLPNNIAFDHRQILEEYKKSLPQKNSPQ